MIAGPRTVASLEHRALLDHHASLHACVRQLAVDPFLEVVEDQAVGLEHVLDLAGVLPPAVHDVRVDPLAGVHEVLDGVGDLELPAPLGSIAPRPRRSWA